MDTDLPRLRLPCKFLKISVGDFTPKMKFWDNRAMNHYENAEEFRLACRYSEARELYERALSAGHDPAECHLGLGHVLRMEGSFAESLKHYEAALEDTSDRELRTDALLGKALAQRGMCRHNLAIPILKEIRRECESEDDEEGLAYTLWALGGAYRIAGKFKKGLNILHQALALYRYLDDRQGITYTNCALGGIYRILGDYDSSFNHYTSANREALKRDDLFGVSYSYCGLGNTFRMRNSMDMALNNFYRAQEGYRILKDRVSYAYTIWAMGTVYKIQGEKEKATDKFKECDGLFEATGDSRGKIYARTGMAEAGVRGIDLDELVSLAEEYTLPWEELIVRTLKVVLEGLSTGDLDQSYAEFETLWRPDSLPLNIP